MQSILKIVICWRSSGAGGWRDHSSLTSCGPSPNCVCGPLVGGRVLVQVHARVLHRSKLCVVVWWLVVRCGRWSGGATSRRRHDVIRRRSVCVWYRAYAVFLPDLVPSPITVCGHLLVWWLSRSSAALPVTPTQSCSRPC